MADVAHYLLDEHRELLPHIEELRIIADSVGDFSPRLLLRGIDKLYDFLIKQLIPRAQAEEETFYPAVAKLLGTPARPKRTICFTKWLRFPMGR